VAELLELGEVTDELVDLGDVGRGGGANHGIGGRRHETLIVSTYSRSEV
jgi:hypothetical protein